MEILVRGFYTNRKSEVKFVLNVRVCYEVFATVCFPMEVVHEGSNFIESDPHE